jgi:DNA-binding beta-propeller fold protein YncE
MEVNCGSLFNCLAKTEVINKGAKKIMAVKSSKWEVKKTTAKATKARLFFLSVSSGQVFSANPDGSDLKVIVSEGRRLPDGIVVDVAAGHLYWTDMGNPSANDGSIERSDLDGSNVTHIIPPGGTFTPKQLQLDAKNRKLYWCDREGMRVMRASLDGSNIETLVDTSEGDSRPGKDIRKWCVGIALDVEAGKVYWTQKGPANAGEGRIFRANLEIPKGQTPANRKDVELLYDNLPEPIDLELDLANRTLYWTDRGDPPRGNTVNRAPMDPSQGNGRKEPQIVFDHLEEGIGIALDLKGGRMFLTDLGGSVYSANLDGSNKKTVLAAEGNLTGIVYAEIPAAQ